MDLNKAKARLDQLLREDSSFNWDGLVLHHIHPISVSKTECLLVEIDKLNHYIDNTSIYPGNMGDVELEWAKKGRKNMLLINIYPKEDNVSFCLIDNMELSKSAIEGVIDNKKWPLSRIIFRYCGEIN